MDGYKTYAGIGLMVFTLLQKFSIIPEMGVDEQTAIIEGLIALVGVVLAVYGRIDVGERLEKASAKKEQVTEPTLLEDNLPG